MILDNEASTDFQLEIQAKVIKLQLSPPGMHHNNAAEHEIRRFKENFIAGL